MYTGARDAKGNSCIKFGTSSAAGKFSFTVDNDVTSVNIYAAKYKSNTSKLVVNDTTYTLTKNSNDGAYDTMIERITGNQNPDFLFMSYSKSESKVNDLILIPKHFFVPDIIEKRKPLAQTARRAGWVGCNIVIDKIPEQGRISIISSGNITNINSILNKVNQSNKLETKNMNSRGWIMDVLNCVNKISTQLFTLEDMYVFECELQSKHPENYNVKPKIRQQLQLLRDKGFIEFLGNGKYRKLT